MSDRSTTAVIYAFTVVASIMTGYAIYKMATAPTPVRHWQCTTSTVLGGDTPGLMVVHTVSDGGLIVDIIGNCESP